MSSLPPDLLLDATPPGDLAPDVRWARSGAMPLAGRHEGPPLLAPGPLAERAHRAVEALRGHAGGRGAELPDGAALLGERAAIRGLRRRGTTAPGGCCRLLRAADGWIALNLARRDDEALLPAWLQARAVPARWDRIADAVAEHRAGDLLERARLLGLPAAPSPQPASKAPPWLRVAGRGPAVARPADARPRVVDLSSLWAGPLAAHLLERCGAQVLKVESRARPDGARRGPRAFFDLLNAGKRSVAIDFGTPEGLRALRALIEAADVVVESARPRALSQLGIDAAGLVERIPGLTWVSITGYGRSAPRDTWVAFGDDAAVAAGLATATGARDGAPLFCGDAIADPLTGVHAALAALASYRAGGGHLLDVSLCDVVASCLADDGRCGRGRVSRTAGGWILRADGESHAVAAPRARTPRGRARPLGADTAAALTEWTC